MLKSCSKLLSPPRRNPASGSFLVEEDGTLSTKRIRSARDMGVGEEEGVEFNPDPAFSV